MNEIKEKVAPTFQKTSANTDNFAYEIPFEEMIHITKTQSKFAYLGAVEKSFDAPGYRLDGSGPAVNDVKPAEPRNVREAVENNPVLQTHDCNSGKLNGNPCGGRGTVTPQESSGVHWRCRQCGMEYTMK